MKNIVLILMGVSVFTFATAGSAQAPRFCNPVKITGTVVAFDLFTSRPLRHSVNDRRNEGYYIVVRGQNSSVSQAEYKLVNFANKVSSDELPNALFDGKSLWTFNLQRYPDCDRILPTKMPVVSGNKDEVDFYVPGLARTPTHNNEDLPSATMPCYRQVGDLVRVRQ